MLKTLSSGFGYLAFASLATYAAQAASASQGGVLAPRASHFSARAKRVIFLCMRGGPSHVDTFDYKPKLNANSGAPGTRPGTKLLGSKWQFAQHGQGGLWISDLFPKVAAAITQEFGALTSAEQFTLGWLCKKLGLGLSAPN